MKHSARTRSLVGCRPAIAGSKSNAAGTWSLMVLVAHVVYRYRVPDQLAHFFINSKTAEVMAFTPVRKVGSGTGAKRAE